MIKIAVGVTFGLLAATMASGCVVRGEPVVIVREPVIVQPAVVVVPTYKYKRRGSDENDQGENEQ